MKAVMIFSVSLATFFVSSRPAQAFYYQTTSSCPKITYPSANITLYANSTSFPQGGQPWIELINSAGRWNLGASSLSITAPQTTQAGLNDGVSEMWFTSSTTLLSGSPAAVFENFSNSTCQISETDIVYSTTPAVPWDFYEDANSEPFYSQNSQVPINARPFIATSIHLMGKSIGLADTAASASGYTIMNPFDWEHVDVNGSASFYQPGSDPGTGAAFLYGNSATARADVSLTARTELNGSGGASSFSVPSGGGACPVDYAHLGLPCTAVSKGGSYSLPVIIENNSTSGSATTFPVEVFLCTTPNLSSGYLLSSYNVTLGTLTAPYQTSLAFTVPAAANSGQYYYLAAEYAGPTTVFSQNHNAVAVVYVQ